MLVYQDGANYTYMNSSEGPSRHASRHASVGPCRPSQIHMSGKEAIQEKRCCKMQAYIDSLYALLSRVFPQCRNIGEISNRAAPTEKLENND